MALFDDIKKQSRSGDFFKPTKRFVNAAFEGVRSGRAFKSGTKGSLFGAALGDVALTPLLTPAANAYFTLKDDPELSASAREVGAAGAVSTLGAFAHLLQDNSGRGAPKVGDAPAQGAGVTAARQEARRRAIAAARARMGLASTISTSPLGLQGTGAATGQRTLTGQ